MRTPLSPDDGGYRVAVYRDREHYIPLRVPDLVELLSRPARLGEDHARRFRQLVDRLTHTFHFESHGLLQGLKDAYAPFDPDQDIQLLREWSSQERQAKLDQLFADFDQLLQKANYTRLTKEKLERAFSSVSAWGIPMQVDFNQFDRLEVYARGDVLGKRSRRTWRTWWKEEVLDVEIFQRTVILVKLKRTKENKLTDADTKDVFLKIFKDIPKADLEMLLPGARVRFSNVDRGKIGFPILTGILLTLWQIFKGVILVALGFAAGAGASTSFMLWGMTAGALGYGYRSYYSYNYTKNQYSLQLTRSLYYQNLDNNAGVLFRLVDAAEEQECREALLGYFFLWQEAGPDGWTEQQLDDHVEAFLEKETQVKVDFEIGDALGKLKRLGLVEELPEGRFRAIDIDAALRKLEEHWRSALGTPAK